MEHSTAAMLLAHAVKWPNMRNKIEKHMHQPLSPTRLWDHLKL